MNDDRSRAKPPHSLAREDAAQIRNAQRSSRPENAEDSTERPEANATMRRVWNEPGGESLAYRNATKGAGGKTDGHEDTTAAATPQTTMHISDPRIHASDEAQADAGSGSGAGEGEHPDIARPRLTPQGRTQDGGEDATSTDGKRAKGGQPDKAEG